MDNISFIMLFIMILPIVFVILISLSLISDNLFKKSRELLSEKNNANIIKTLQEIACDYRVRIIRSGYCILSIDGIICRGKFIDDKTKDSGDCILFEHSQIEFSDNGKLYCIHFRLFGKHYISYGNNELICWSNAVQRARKENKKLFSKIGV